MKKNKSYRPLVWDREPLEKFWDYESQFPEIFFLFL
jgi:hypothetical protein